MKVEEGVMSVLVGWTFTFAMSTPSLYATACATFVYRPWPISTPAAQSDTGPRARRLASSDSYTAATRGSQPLATGQKTDNGT